MNTHTDASRPLTDDEQIIVAIVRQQTRLDGCPVATKDIRDLASRRSADLNFGRVNRLLVKLTRDGVLAKPTPGNYVLAVVGEPKNS